MSRRSSKPFAVWATDSRASTNDVAGASFEPDQVAEEEVLTLSERADVPICERQDEERSGPHVRHLRSVRRPGGHDVVPGLPDDLDACAVARSEVQFRWDVEMRDAIGAS